VDIRELIESGSLELYVLGALPAEEMRQIDTLRTQDPQVEAEIQKILEATASYGALHARRPKADLKEKIAQKLNIPEEKANTVMVVIPSFYRYAVAASVLLIMGLSYTTYHFYSKYNESYSALLAMQNEKSVLANQVNLLNTEAQNIKNQLAVVDNPLNKQILLNGLPISPDAKALVYWNQQSGSTYINTSLLPQIAANEQYQLWAIVDGKPVDMGVLDKTGTFQKMKDVKTPVAFAITVEPLGGKPSPTLEKMYVLGNV
jgi:anti-sigma-K factor RskA